MSIKESHEYGSGGIGRMRPIKFRAWDEEHKEMYEWEQYKSELVAGDFESKILKLMQYTGLKDKNGKEIYEGDLVSAEKYVVSMLRHWGVDADADIELYEIKFVRGSFRLCDLKDGDWVAVIDHHAMSKAYELSVIGNIYENPELLEREAE